MTVLDVGLRPGLVPGHNVDRIDLEAGLRELAACGYTDPCTVMVVDYALNRHARGEEQAALRGAIDRSFHGIDLTSWYRVLAAALAGAMPAPPARVVTGVAGELAHPVWGPDAVGAW